jgi:hypothetical protein
VKDIARIHKFAVGSMALGVRLLATRGDINIVGLASKLLANDGKYAFVLLSLAPNVSVLLRDAVAFEGILKAFPVVWLDPKEGTTGTLRTPSFGNH